MVKPVLELKVVDCITKLKSTGHALNVVSLLGQFVDGVLNILEDIM
jgi:hypothetical protein